MILDFLYFDVSIKSSLSVPPGVGHLLLPCSPFQLLFVTQHLLSLLPPLLVSWLQQMDPIFLLLEFHQTLDSVNIKLGLDWKSGAMF